MGNWITVNIEGKVNKDEAKEMLEWLTVDRQTYSSIAEEQLGVYYLQISQGVCGLGDWIKEDGTLSGIGNVFERDCEPQDLLNEAQVLCKQFKSLELTVHVGGDYESTECVATIIGNKDKVELLEPQIKTLGEISTDQMQNNLLKALGLKL